MTCWRRRRDVFFDRDGYISSSSELASASSVDQKSELDIQTKMSALRAAASVVSLRSLIGDRVLFLCSGIIVESKADEDGGFTNYILTAASLFAGPSGEPSMQSDIKVYVYLEDGKPYEGEVHPSQVDFHYNLALIKMKSDSSLPEPVVRYLDDYIPMKPEASVDATSYQLRPYRQSGKEEEDSKYVNIHPGDQVMALARTFWHSVLMVETGRFSLELCTWDIQELFVTTCKTYEYFIGGPLINDDGEVVGITFSDGGYSPFLPSNIAWKCLECFKKHEIVHRPSHGILASNLYATDVAVLEKLMLKFPDIEAGVVAEEIKIGSPAASAGLQPSDVILCCNGSRGSCLLRFFEILWDNAGKCVDMEVKRVDGACLKLVMPVEETPPEKFYKWPDSEEWRQSEIFMDGDPEAFEHDSMEDSDHDSMEDSDHDSMEDS